MKPGQIQVFDGLRITTEHINHLQGSLHSAVQDIREILGLGRVHTGLKVEAHGDHSITVQPGLAFDNHRNRVVCEQPKVLEVIFEAEQKRKYVFVKYEQVEDGIVEGKPTLIWDSCSVLLRDELPESWENLVPLVALIARDDSKEFDIVTLPLVDENQMSKHLSEAENTEIEETKTGTELEEYQIVAEVIPSSEKAPPQISAEQTAKTETTPDDASVVMGKNVNVIKTEETQQETLASMPDSWKWPVQQGVIRVNSGSQGASLSNLVEPLRQRLSQRNDDSQTEMHLTMARKKIALEFSPVSLTGQTLLNATIQLKTDTGHRQMIFQVNAKGEATFTNYSVNQFGVSTIQSQLYTDTRDGPPLQSRVTERGIAELSFTAGSMPAGLEFNLVLDRLDFLVTLNLSENEALDAIWKLVWKGGVDEEISRVIKQHAIHLFWESTLAWKATGNK